jgi:antitoxin component HigA of HigAB toxin-antitoxin module
MKSRGDLKAHSNIVAGPGTAEDLEYVRKNRHNPFLKDGRVDIEAYLQFVTEFNEFINHAPKPFRPIVDRDMRL